MRRFARLYSTLAIAILALVACEKPVPESEASRITLASKSVKVAAEGGEFTLRYSIANPVEGEKLQFDYDAEWIKSITAEDGNIRLSIEANTGDKREAEVTVSYKNADATSFVVAQAAKEADAFTIDIEEITGTSCITRVTPRDKEMYYVMYKSDISYFGDSNIATADELFEDDMFYFKRGAAFDGLSLREYMERNKVLFQDVTRAAWPDLRPAQKQVLYVYGIEFNDDEDDCARVTDIQWVLIDPPTADLGDATFEVDVTVDGADVTFDITPNGWDGHYTVQIFDYNEELYCDAEEVTDDYIRSVGNGWITMFGNNLDGGLKPEEILNATCFMGKQQAFYELASYTLYTALVYAVEEIDGFYQMVSRPVVVNFSTEKVEASDMTIDIAVDNLYVRVCDLKVTPSTDDETYAMLLTPTEYFEEGYTDEDLLEAALDKYLYYTNFFRGEITAHVSNLYPTTEYVVVCFGYSGGVVTTPVFKKVFKTDEEGICEVAITDVAYGGPYCPSEVRALDPERFYNIPDNVDEHMFIMWMEVKTDKPTDDIFTYFVDTETYDYYGEETIFFDLLISTCPHITIDIAQYIFNYYICAAAFDYKGDVTPMWRSEVLTFKPEDLRPAEELLAKLDGSTRAEMVMVDGRTGKISAVRK